MRANGDNYLANSLSRFFFFIQNHTPVLAVSIPLANMLFGI